jgi:hypothetical protein
MTTGNAIPGEMTDDELEAAQLRADGEIAGNNPVVGNADETATTDTAAASNVATDGVDASHADPAALDAGGDAKPDTQPEKVMGVASKDGTRILPYAALQAERRSARAYQGKYESTARELEDAKQLIADMKAGKTPESGAITESDVIQAEEDFPELGKKMRALFEQNKELESSNPASNARTDQEPSDDPLQEAIDQVPLLVEWQHGDVEKFGRAQEFDRALVNSPKWRDKPAVERFEHVAKLVAEEYDIEIPVAKPSNTTKPMPSPDLKTVVASATRAAPNTLSDFKGGAVADHGTADLTKMGSTAMLGRFMDMTDAEIDAQLARLG